jgi:hypothetical protein
MKTLRNTSIVLSILALALFIAAPVAMAGTITEPISGPVTVGPSLTPVSANFSILQFDPSLGTLTSVTINITDIGTTTLAATSTDIDTLDDIDTKLTLLVSGGGASKSQTLYVDSGITDPPGVIVTTTSPYNSGPLTITGSATDNVSSADWAAFTGTGYVPFTFTANAETQITEMGGNLTPSQITNAGVDVSITYDYTNPGPPVIPEPSTLSLFGSGLLGLAGMLRYKFAK